MPLMCIEKAWRPRCFTKKTGPRLGFDYHANRKSWMTTELFVSWLYRFSSYISRYNPQRRVMLLLDNCSSHGSAESLPYLSNVDYQFLPPNTTSKLQPLDAGIIAALKSGYRERKYDHAVDCIDAGAAEIYKIDQPTAMRWMRDCWESTTARTVSNCWCHTGLIEQGSTGAGQMEQEIKGTGTSNSAVVNLRGVEAALSALVSPQVRARMETANLVSPEGENDCHEVVDINSLFNEAAGSIGSHSQGEEEGKILVMSLLDSVSLQEKLKAVVIVRQLLAENNCIEADDDLHEK